MVIQKFDIGVPSQEPKQFIKDRLQMQLFRGEERESSGQWKPGLRAKDRLSAGASSIGLKFALLHDKTQKLVILKHLLEQRRISAPGPVLEWEVVHRIDLNQRWSGRKL